MKSKGYDFLDGVLGSDKIPKEQSKSLDETVSVIPKKHLDVIRKTVKEVDIVPNRGRCSYGPDSKTLILDPGKMNESIIHEFGHVMADAYDIYNDSKFIEILAKKLDNNWSNIYPINNPDIPGEFIYVMDSPKFINIYQGRTYADISSADYSQPIPLNTFQEYFSVAFDAYFKEPQKLKEKDIGLFNYIEELIKNG